MFFWILILLLVIMWLNFVCFVFFRGDYVWDFCLIWSLWWLVYSWNVFGIYRFLLFGNNLYILSSDNEKSQYNHKFNYRLSTLLLDRSWRFIAYEFSPHLFFFKLILKRCCLRWWWCYYNRLFIRIYCFYASMHS